MILPKIKIPNLANKTLKFYSPDTLSDCRYQKQFKKYPHVVEYNFNSRGFRDAEWPEDLENAIWCLGDSATVGLGAPIQHSWPAQLSEITGMPTINLGIRAIDNYTISEIAQEIISTVRPKNLVILWSFFERRPIGSIHTELTDSSCQVVLDDYIDHIFYFEKCLANLEHSDNSTNIVHGFVPNYCIADIDQVNQIWNSVRDFNWPEKITSLESIDNYITEELTKVHDVYQTIKFAFAWEKFKTDFMKNVVNKIKLIDLARDGIHGDIRTNKLLAEEFKAKLN